MPIGTDLRPPLTYLTRLPIQSALTKSPTLEGPRHLHPILDTLCVELLATCPLRCLHCSASASPSRRSLLPQDVVKAGLFALKSLEEIYFSGGEPFLYPDLPDLVRVATTVAKHVIVYSSGTFQSFDGLRAIPPDRLRLAATAGVRRIDVSFYAANAVEHDAITQAPGSFASTGVAPLRWTLDHWARCP